MSNKLNALPKYVRLDLRDTYEIFDRLSDNTELPILDTEAILSLLIEVLYKPTINRTSSDTVRFIIREVIGYTESNDQNQYYMLQAELQSVLNLLLKEFNHYKLYTENRLMYDYDRRFTHGTALLRRKSSYCL